MSPAAKMKIVSKQARAMSRRWKQSLSPGRERTARVNTFPGGGGGGGGGEGGGSGGGLYQRIDAETLL